MTDSRLIILRILERFDKHPGNVDLMIDKELKKSPVDRRDRRFIFEIVNGIVRRRLTIDHAIGHYLNDRSLVNNKRLMRLLELGVYQLAFMDRVPDHAAVNETVRCARGDGRSEALSGIVNGVLRSVIKGNKRVIFNEPDLDVGARLSIEYSHPRWMVSRWLGNFGLSKTKQLLAFNNEKPELYLRRKIHGLSRQQFETESRDFLSPAGGYGNLYYRLIEPGPPDALDLFADGYCTVQTPSSGWVVALLDARGGDAVLDVCSAPGGKSALIGEIAAANGRVYSCEINAGRMKLVAETIGRMRLTNVVLVRCDGKALPFSRPFKKVLLDAPCSGTGVLHRHSEARWIKKPEDIGKMSLLQEKLLEASAGLVAAGGTMVYSTCSLEPEENELRVQAFLASHPDFVLDAPPGAIPAQFVDGKGFLRITPYDHKLDGMFGARLKKTTEKRAS